MTSAGFFGLFGISIFIGLIFLIIAAWRNDRRGRSLRAPEILSLRLDMAAAEEDILSSIKERCRNGKFPFLLG